MQCKAEHPGVAPLISKGEVNATVIAINYSGINGSPLSWLIAKRLLLIIVPIIF
jgi:hypothetical protein